MTDRDELNRVHDRIDALQRDYYQQAVEINKSITAIEEHVAEIKTHMPVQPCSFFTAHERAHEKNDAASEKTKDRIWQAVVRHAPSLAASLVALYALVKAQSH